MSWQWHLEYSPQISENMIFKGPLFGSEGSLCSRKISKHSSLQEARPNCLEAKVLVKVIWHLICFLVSQLEFDVSFLWSFFFGKIPRKRWEKDRETGGVPPDLGRPRLDISAVRAIATVPLTFVNFIFEFGFSEGRKFEEKIIQVLFRWSNSLFCKYSRMIFC